jgi:hypothetical protein
MPHGPYEVDEQCVPYLERLLGDSNGRKSRIPDSLRVNRPARYRAQVRCTHRVLGQFLDQVDEVYGPKQATIIVHGDHGSRAVHRCEPNVSCKPPAATPEQIGSFRPVDFMAEFAVLLAVRGPDSKGVVHWGPTPVQDLLWAFVRNEFKTLPPGHWEQSVHISQAGHLVPYPLRSSDMLWVQDPETPAIEGSR